MRTNSFFFSIFSSQKVDPNPSTNMFGMEKILKEINYEPNGQSFFFREAWKPVGSRHKSVVSLRHQSFLFLGETGPPSYQQLGLTCDNTLSRLFCTE